ncbi:MAG TPA: heparinase II/III family protein [Edaphobacter sp.]|nr:heparinase II/III family protein [Edaphobacter sp.]
MRILNAIALCGMLLFSFLQAHAQEGPPVPTPMGTLQAAHPRLFVHDSDLPAIKARIAADPMEKAEFDRIHARAVSLLTEPPERFQLGGPRPTLLPIAREMEGRIITLSGVYRLTGDKRFADRAIAEMLSAADFPDWHPRTPLNTAELTAAMGIGYDWLYPVLTSGQRNVIRQAIVAKGIHTFFARIDRNQMHYRNNWAQVIYGGHTVAALAIAEPDDQASMERAEKVIGYSRPGIELVMKLFAPDGGFEEGPVYWDYATIYNVLYITALDSALGTDFGASKMAGFDVTPEYEIQATGPSFEYANFSDSHAEAGLSSQMYWFATRFHRPAYAAYERALMQSQKANGKLNTSFFQHARFEMIGLFWAAMTPEWKSFQPLPEVESFARIQQAYMRTSWSDPDAAYIGFKGGEAGVSHGHLDLGSFVFDDLGQRWASDLGPETYGVPDYFGKLRWTYYRTQTRAHNTIAVDNSNEDTDGLCKIIFAGSVGKNKFIVADLDQAHKTKLQSWKRGIAILGNRRVLVQDEISPSKPVELVWHLHTFANVEIAADKRSATLRIGDKTMRAKIITPADAHFSIAPPPVLKPKETPNTGVTDLVIDQPQTSTSQTIAVLFSRKGDNKIVHLKKLADWSKK